jgi:hypothetical protein
MGTDWPVNSPMRVSSSTCATRSSIPWISTGKRRSLLQTANLRFVDDSETGPSPGNAIIFRPRFILPMVFAGPSVTILAVPAPHTFTKIFLR